MRFWKYRDRTAVDTHGNFVVPHANVVDTEAEVRDAYKRGRKDERARHKSHPILTLIIFLVALVGGVMLFLAAREGSFSRAGQVADQQLAVAATEGPGVVRDAAANVADAARDARTENDGAQPSQPS
jgi:hypothetical protein